MRIKLNAIGKRFNSEWIFKNVNYLFESGESYAIVGGNGSGKSTFLQLISGKNSHSSGSINYFLKDQEVAIENIFQKMSYSAPYLDLFEEFTLKETIEFQKKFKQFRRSTAELINLCYLENASDKLLKYYSSGMKQRVKLMLAIESETPLLLLDEPCSNLDQKGIEWYQQLMQEKQSNRTILVCSNSQENEIQFCKQKINIESYKPE
jgi:ABC-type multidrug transport system ATPase subunit